MVSIAVLSTAVAAHGPVPFKGDQAGKGPAFWHLIRIGRSFGIAFFLARRSDWDGRSQILRRAYTHDRQRWLRCSDVPFDAILPRVDLRVRRPPPIVYWNDRRVWRVCADKWLTYRHFRAFSPRTWRLRSAAYLRVLRQRYPEQAFVLKPRFGRQARGVVFLRPGAVAPRRFTESMLLQKAITGGSFLRRPGVWDVRCFVQDGQLDLAYLKHGSARDPILNVHRGTRVVRLPVRALPASSVRFVRQIDRAFDHIRPRHYCVDFRYDERRRPMLIELNHLSVLPWGAGPDYPRFYKHLCRIVLADVRRASVKRNPQR